MRVGKRKADVGTPTPRGRLIPIYNERNVRLQPFNSVDYQSARLESIYDYNLLAMSGFEVAGLAIGIAGLMISTVEHFDKVTEPLKFYFEFSSRFEQLNDKVEVQRAIFQLQFRLLLSSVAEQEEVDEMMKSRLSPLWQSDELNSSLEGLYGDHYSAWRKSVGLVGEKLCKITEKLDIFAKDLSASEVCCIIPLLRMGIY